MILMDIYACLQFYTVPCDEKKGEYEIFFYDFLPPNLERGRRN